MSDIKIVSIDIDGTLLNDQHEVTPAVHQAITMALEQGTKIVITTGRPLTGVRPILDELGITGSDQYVITHNGGLMQTADGSKILFATPLSLTNWKMINQFMRANSTYIQVESQDSAYTTNHRVHPWASFENSLVNLPLYVLENDEALQDVEIIKGIANAEVNELDEIQARIPASISGAVSVIRSTANNLEFINKQASKGNALIALARELGVDMSQTMAIGDQENDLTMIEVAGVGVAMENAIDRIKGVATVQTASNNDSGVAKALEKYVL